MVLFDYQRAPSKKEAEAFQARVARLQGQFGYDVRRIEKVLRENYPPGRALDTHGYRVREGFSYLTKTPHGGYSDRRVLPRKHRPPATRILSSRGATLRFYLTALAVAQMSGSTGAKLPVLPITGSVNDPGWTQLVATGAENTGDARNYITASDKRARSIKTSLGTLNDAGLVELRPTKAGGKTFENFVLLNESGKSLLDDSVEYKIPRPAEVTINLPSEFVRQGWLHVLEDSELAVLLMLACGRGSLQEENQVIAIPSEERVIHYGIGRDPYSRARKTLELFGLVSVNELGRHFDGKAEGDEPPQLHRFRILSEGFSEPALEVVQAKLRHQLKRKY